MEEHLLPRMKDLVIDALLSVKTRINPRKRKNCFELFGFDFLVDEDFRTWLIEVNTNPYLGTPCSEMKRMVPEMINELLGITVDPFYPPRTGRVYPKSFELIYQEGKLNQRRPFSIDLCYPIPAFRPQAGNKRFLPVITPVAC